MWGAVIILFVSLWILQIVLSALQLKHYQNTVRKMSNRTSGYLGVGVDKRKLGVGSVVILVCDRNGTVVDSKKMYGVTVFQRFTEYTSVLSKHINKLNIDEKDNLYTATKMAIQNIKTQIQAS